mmetsp:Transcript_46033/g.60984  ORF Transcript_46033/g.60984 Transcript_46033/m.60984 type:complete len:90 (-) Transcript_46033:158-427(-)
MRLRRGPTLLERQRVEEPKMWAGNPHNFAAPELKVNCIEAKIEEQRLQKIMFAANNAKVTADFDKAYPEFQKLLEWFTPSAIFNKCSNH